MAQRYHLGDDGQPRECNADYKCPKGGDAPHFTGDIKDARAWAEEQNSQAAGGSFGSKSKPESTLADDALAVSERKLEAEKQDLAENEEAVSTIQEDVDDLRANAIGLDEEGADQEDTMEAWDEVYAREADKESYEDAIGMNLQAIEDIESDIELAKREQNKEESDSLIDTLPTEKTYTPTKYPRDVSKEKVALYHQIEKGESQIRQLQKTDGKEAKQTVRRVNVEISKANQALVHINNKEQGNRKPDPNQSFEEQKRDYAENIVPNASGDRLVADFRSSTGAMSASESGSERSNAQDQQLIVQKELHKRLSANKDKSVSFDRSEVKVKTHDDKEHVFEQLPNMGNNDLVHHYEKQAVKLASAKKGTQDYYEYVESEKNARRELEGRLNAIQN